MRHERASTIKVGLLTLISLLVLVSALIWLRGRGLPGGQNFEVAFKDVDGLRAGAPVQFMGIRVGFVEDAKAVLLKDKKDKRYRVNVKFSVTEPSIKIPKGTHVSIQQSGIIGEKFLELTPPHPREYTIVLPYDEGLLKPDVPIKVQFKEGFKSIGVLKDVKFNKKRPTLRGRYKYYYKLIYVLNQPGYTPPKSVHFTLVKDDEPYLLLMDDQAVLTHVPNPDAYFTLEEPLRLKSFLEQQLSSADSLKHTNDKINELLSRDTIDAIQGTLKNTEQLTAKATSVLDEANTLLSSTAEDLDMLVASAEELTDSIVSVSNNINDLAGDPQLKQDIIDTVSSVEKSTSALATILNDPALTAILTHTEVTTENAAELMAYLRAATVDNDLEGKLTDSLGLLHTSLEQLSSILKSVDVAIEDEEQLKRIISDTENTTENLSEFSERLNKRFLLFRLLF